MTDAPPPIALALGRIPTGLYVVTTRAGDAPIGFVGSFVMQVGFEPPTVSVAIGRSRDHLAAIRNAGRFGISVLDAASSKLMNPFFKKYGPGASPFDHIPHVDSPGGVPILPDALAWLECRVNGEHATGDHVVVFGTVEHAALAREGEPSIRLRKNGLEY